MGGIGCSLAQDRNNTMEMNDMKMNNARRSINFFITRSGVEYTALLNLTKGIGDARKIFNRIRIVGFAGFSGLW